MNSLSIAGYIGGDADTRIAPSGTAVSTFSVPVEQGWGEHKKTTWVRCVIFGEKGTGMPHGLVQYLRKGKFVAVKGEIVMEEWEKDGRNHCMLKCIVDDITPGPVGSSKPAAAPASAPVADPAPAPAGIADDDIPF